MLNLRMRSRKPVPRALQSWRLQQAIHRIKAPHQLIPAIYSSERFAVALERLVASV